MYKSNYKGSSGETDRFSDPGDTAQNEAKVQRDKVANRSHARSLSYSTLYSDLRPTSHSIITGEVELEQTFPQGMSYLLSALFATVLEETLIKLRILVESGSQILINNLMQSMDEHWAAKFGVAPGPVKDELAGITYRNIDCEEFKLNKLDADRAFFTRVIGSTYSDLVLRLNFVSLKKYIAEMQYLTRNYEIEAEDELKNRMVFKDLRRQLRQQRVLNKTLVYDAMVKQDTLEKKIEDAELTEETGLRHVHYWERARSEQNLEKIRQTEERYEDKINTFKEKQEQEQRIHAEIETFVTIATRDAMDQVEYWMAKYDKDLEQIDLKLQIKRNSYLGMVEKREALERKFEERNQRMEAWIQYKGKRAADREHREKLMNSAIIVQAWWRGLLVRKQLGPYRPSKRRRASIILKKLAKQK